MPTSVVSYRHYGPPGTVTVWKKTRASTSQAWSKIPWKLFANAANAQGTNYFDVSRTKVTVEDPLWKSKIARGVVCINPYSISGTAVDYGTFTANDAYYYAAYEAYCFAVTGVGCGGDFVKNTLLSVPPGYSSSLEAQVVTAMQAGVNSGAVELLVSLAEAHKTFSMITGAATKIARVLHDFRGSLRSGQGLREIQSFVEGLLSQGKVPKNVRSRTLRREMRRVAAREAAKPSIGGAALNAIDEALGLWLEWRYGWRILLFEIEGAFKATAELQLVLQDVLRRERSRQSLGTSYTDSATQKRAHARTNVGSPPFATEVFEYSFIRTRATLIRGEAVGFYSLDYMGALDKELGLHIVPTMYELIPLSFVVDWFVNLGDWLTAHTAFVPGLKMKGAQFGQLREYSKEYIVTSATMQANNFAFSTFVNNGENTTDDGPGGTRIKRFSFDRKVINPSEVYAPQFSNGVNLLRAIDAVALLSKLGSGLLSDARKSVRL